MRVAGRFEEQASRGAQVARAFLTPRRGPHLEAEDVIAGGRRRVVAGPDGAVGLVEAGDGPTVLLLHGWEGRASDLAAFAPPLLAAGMRVAAMDLPAHGASAGDLTSIPAAAAALVSVGAALGPLRAVIAHSVGSAVTVEALVRGLAAERVALIGAPARYVDYARAFALHARLDAGETAQMIAALSAQHGVDVHAVSLPARAPMLRQPALFVHAEDDRTVAIADALESAAAWPGARLLRLADGGHRRILQAPAVVDAVTRFVRDDAPAALGAA